MKNLHFHDGYEIGFTVMAGCGIYLKNSSYSLNHGGLVLVNSSELHRTSVPEKGIYERYTNGERYGKELLKNWR